MIDLYEEIGAQKEASSEDIKKAYRKKAKRLHPDVGGDPNRFRSLAHAYKILSDDEKRKRYDNGEDPSKIGDANDPQKNATQLVVETFLSVVNKCNDVDHKDILGLVRQEIQSGIAKFKDALKAGNAQIKKYESVMKRISIKKRSDPIEVYTVNIFKKSLEWNIGIIKANMAECENNIEIGKLAIKALDYYEYLADLNVMNSYRVEFSTGIGTSTSFGGF